MPCIYVIYVSHLYIHCTESSHPRPLHPGVLNKKKGLIFVCCLRPPAVLCVRISVHLFYDIVAYMSPLWRVWGSENPPSSRAQYQSQTIRKTKHIHGFHHTKLDCARERAKKESFFILLWKYSVFTQYKFCFVCNDLGWRICGWGWQIRNLIGAYVRLYHSVVHQASTEHTDLPITGRFWTDP